jgi:hypothetical protein
VADALELGLDVARGRDIAVGEMAEVELDAGCKHHSSGTSSMVIARLPRLMVEAKCQGASRWVVLWVESLIHSMAQPSPVRQILLAQAGEELDDVGRGLAVGGIVDLRPVAGRVGGDVVLQRHGNVDQCARHVKYSSNCDVRCLLRPGKASPGRGQAGRSTLTLEICVGGVTVFGEGPLA